MPEDEPPESATNPEAAASAVAADSPTQEDFVHESVELPPWIPVVFGVILIVIAVTAIWMAAGW